MKCNIGVDASSGLVHTITATSANVHDITEAHKLIHKDDGVVYVDLGYIGIEKRKEIKNDEHFSKVEYRINRHPKKFATGFRNVRQRGIAKHLNKSNVLFACAKRFLLDHKLSLPF